MDLIRGRVTTKIDRRVYHFLGRDYEIRPTRQIIQLQGSRVKELFLLSSDMRLIVIGKVVHSTQRFSSFTLRLHNVLFMRRRVQLRRRSQPIPRGSYTLLSPLVQSINGDSRN